MLRLPPRQLPGIGSTRGAQHQTTAGADGRADARIPRGGADGRSKSGAEHCSYCGACDGVLIGNLLRRKTNLLGRPVAAYGVVNLELLERLAGSRQDHDTWPGRH